MAAEEAKERWTSGDQHELYVGRWSRLVAHEFLAWLQAPAGIAWLDVGCGTGALTDAIAQEWRPATLAGVEGGCDWT